MHSDRNCAIFFENKLKIFTFKLGIVNYYSYLSIVGDGHHVCSTL